ncbi:MAG: formylglycine-generating enzyme family protein, partial [Armatimonadetes bacterium]|nr:formylglycine-generating enzyme family protein [Armatimonadota bacterium]
MRLSLAPATLLRAILVCCVCSAAPAALKLRYSGEVVYIPAGSFLMGNSGVGDDAALGQPEELPQRSVYLPDYYIGKYEVTRGEYRAFMDAGGYSKPAYWSRAGWKWRVSSSRTQPHYWAPQQNWANGEFTQTDNHPVVGVSYYEAEAFCKWAGGHLPTQAQWEKAARWNGTSSKIYPWGNTWDVEKCNNYMDKNPAGGYGLYRTTPVGSYPDGASPYGCLDMAGNAREWCQDWYKSYPRSAQPFDYANAYYVLRGGSWYYNPGDDKNKGDTLFSCRSANRGSSRLPYGSNYDYGFRMAAGAPGAGAEKALIRGKTAMSKAGVSQGRVIYNLDCSEYFVGTFGGVVPETIDKFVDEHAAAGVTDLFINVNAQRTNYHSDVWESYWDGYDPKAGDNQPFFEGIDMVNRPW